MIHINNNDILNFLTSQGMINLDDVRANMKEKEKERLLAKHKYKIFYDSKDNRWKTTVEDETKKNGRRLIAKRDKEKLSAFLVAYYGGLEDEKYIDDNIPTLSSIFPKWLKYKATQTNATSYAKRILVDWKAYYANTEIAELPITDLTYLTLNKWAHDLVKNKSLTKKQYYNASIIMRQCLDYVCEPEIGLLESNAFRRVKVNSNLFTKKEKPKSNEQVFQTDEQKKLCEEAKSKFDARPWCTSPLIILLNFQIGLRIGEVCALKWEDVEDNYVHVQRMETTDYILSDDGTTVAPNGYKIVPYTKSSAGDRRVYLNSAAKEILRLIKATNLKYGYYDDGFIYIKSRQKSRATSRTLTKYLEDLCLASGVTNKSNHKIRKTYISSLFDLNININTIREQAGHEDERTSLNNYCFDQHTESVIEAKLESASNKTMCI